MVCVFSKAFLLDRVISKNQGKEWGFEGNDKDWRVYLGRATYWEMASTRATKIVTSIIASSGFESRAKNAKPMKYF